MTSVAASTSRASTNHNDRIICLIDMDCFYVQVEEVEQPQYRGKPCGVSQYNPYRGGGLIAVNYEARKFGVKRGMRGEDAKALCPEFQTFYVNQKRGKADLAKYRNASLKIFEIISKYNCIVEKASIDEAYIDLTDLVLDKIRNRTINKINICDLNDSFLVGSFTLENNTDREANLNAWLESITDLTIETNDVMLVVGALIVKEIRDDIFNTLGFHCSAGLAHNKTLAKFCCGINKPNKQTILPLRSVEGLLETSPINKIKNLGGKLGFILSEELNLKTVGDLARLSLNELVKKFGEKTGTWLNQISHGIDLEPVQSRQTAKSIGCSKNFRGKQALDTFKKVEYWIRNLCEELEERLEDDKTINQREPTQLVVHVTNEAGTFSKSTNINNQKKANLSEHLIEMISVFNKNTSSSKQDWYPVIFTLGLAATKFVDLNNKSKSNSLMKYFSNATNTLTTMGNNNNNNNSNSNGDEVEILNNETTSCSTSKSISEEFEKTSLSLVTDSKQSRNDIRSLLMNQQKSKITSNEDDDSSDKDADSDVLLCNEEENENRQFNDKNNFIDENIDLIRCEKCNKKILAWEMPEHEDFHFAQALSKEICTSSSLTSNSTTKRSIEEIDEKESSKKSVFINKKQKTGDSNKNATHNNKNSKQLIDKYFKKL